jgi:hypothetical protein
MSDNGVYKLIKCAPSRSLLLALSTSNTALRHRFISLSLHHTCTSTLATHQASLHYTDHRVCSRGSVLFEVSPSTTYTQPTPLSSHSPRNLDTPPSTDKLSTQQDVPLTHFAARCLCGRGRYPRPRLQLHLHLRYSAARLRQRHSR